VRTHVERWGGRLLRLRQTKRTRAAAAALAALAAVGVLLVSTSASGRTAATPDQVGQWSSPISWPLIAVHSALEDTGLVRVFDAFDFEPNSERLWDPATGTFIAVPYGRNLFCSGHVILSDGRDLIVGGHIQSNVGLKDTTIFDPVARTWTRASDMTQSRWYPTATTLGDGRVLVVSGDNMILGRTGVPQPFVDTSNTLPEVFDPSTNAWTDLTNAQRYIPLYPFMFVMPDGRVFDAGPDTINRALNVNTGIWTTIATSPIDGGSAVMYRAGKILKAGRWGDPGVVYDGDGRAAVIDLNQPSPSWREVAPMAFAREFHNLLTLPDGNVLAVGGATGGGGYTTSNGVLAAELWNPNTETWTTMAAEQIPRMYHSTSLLLPDARVLVAGGGRFHSYDELNAEIYSPPYLFKGPRPTITAAPSAAGYGTSFTVSTPDAAGIGSVSLIRTGSMTHAFDENARFLALSFTKNAGSLTVQAPANGNVAPPGPYMLFIVDTNGVPSVAKFVRMQPTAPDPNPPTVSITAPANGATLSGVTTLTASANDDVAVLGVQFKLDGAPIGAEDTTAPYSISWDSATATNGPHTLTAVARDASNTTTSNPVNITASNASPGLVASYSFDEAAGTTLTDVSGHGNNGTIANGAWSTSGKFGSALSFNGTNSIVTVPDSNLLDLTSGMTLEAWVRPAANGGVWRTVLFKEQTGKTTYDLYGNTGTDTPEAGVWIGSERTVKGTALPLNAWSHLAATYDGAALKIYVNGALAGTLAQTGNITTSTGPLKIGGNTIYPEWFSGLIDEVRIYNRALTQAEIQTDMSTSVGVPDTQPPTAPSNLVGTGQVSSVVLSWTGSTDNVGIARYDLYRSSSPGFTPSAGNRIAQPTGTTFTDTGLAAGTYYYKVLAEDAAGNISPASNEAAATVTGDVTPPTAPTNLAAVAGPGQAALSWTASTDNVGVARYDVHRSTTPGFTPSAGTKIGQSTTAGYSDTGLTPGTYYYKVIAYDASNNPSPASNQASATITNAPPTGLVAAYGFDEATGTTLNDLSGNGNIGTINGPTWTPSGKYGSALSFDGVNDWVTVNDSNSLDLTTGMTLAAWVKPAALGTAWRTVLFKEQPGNLEYGLYANRDNGKPNGQVFAGGSAQEVDGTALTLNAWTHLAVTYDGSMLTLWINGAQAATLLAVGNIGTSTGVLRIGGNNIWPEWFSGLIDEVRIYNRPLSQAEIQADMNRPVGTPDTQPPTAPTNLTAAGSVSSVALTWTASTDNVGVAKYDVYRSAVSGFTPSLANRIAQPTGTTFTDTGLAAGTYFYKVQAEDAGGNLSGASNEASTSVTGDLIAPSAPSGLTALAGPGQASLSWTASTDNVAVTNYDVYRSTVAGFVPSVANRIAQPTGTGYGDTGLAPGTYYYLVAAEDAAGNVSAPSNQATVTVTNAPPAGLVASFGFEEGTGSTVADSSGNGNNGSITGATWTTAGKYGSALSFNGTNNLVSVPDSNSLDLTTAMTLEAWVKPTALGTTWRTVLMKERSANMSYDLYANDDKGFPETAVWIGGEKASKATAGLPLNAWTHLAATYDGANLRLYVNGTQTATIAQTGSITTSTGALRIGGNNVWPEWFSGVIDEVRVYNRALSATEITNDMNRSVSSFAALGTASLRPADERE